MIGRTMLALVLASLTIVAAQARGYPARPVKVIGSSAEEAEARLRADTELWARIVKAANMRVD